MQKESETTLNMKQGRLSLNEHENKSNIAQCCLPEKHFFRRNYKMQSSHHLGPSRCDVHE